MFESIQISGIIFNNFWNSVPNSRSKSFCPVLVFQKGWFSLRKPFLVFILIFSAGLKTSFIQAGHLFLTNLNTVDVTHCWNLLFIGSQFSLWKCSFDICSLLFSFKQNLMHLFCVSCSLSFSFFDRFGYHAVQA